MASAYVAKHNEEICAAIPSLFPYGLIKVPYTDLIKSVKVDLEY
jgi:hypothetical protein